MFCLIPRKACDYFHESRFDQFLRLLGGKNDGAIGVRIKSVADENPVSRVFLNDNLSGNFFLDPDGHSLIHNL